MRHSGHDETFRASIMLQVPLIAEEDDVEPWYSYVLKTERPEVVEGAVSSTPSRASSTYEPEQKVTVSLLCEISKEIMGLYAKAKKGAASAHPSILVWPQCKGQKMPARKSPLFQFIAAGYQNGLQHVVASCMCCSQKAWPASTSSAHVGGVVNTDNAERCHSQPEHTGFGIRESDKQNELGMQSLERMAHKLVRRLCLEDSLSRMCWHYSLEAYASGTDAVKRCLLCSRPSAWSRCKAQCWGP